MNAQSSTETSKFDQRDSNIFARVQFATMTSAARVDALCDAVKYVIANKIPGDFVECGVWRGGSSMAMMLKLIELNSSNRHVHLFDTFEGMTPPSVVDVDNDGISAASQLAQQDKLTSAVWAYAGLNEVKNNVYSTGYPPELVSFIQGPVEETIPESAPGEIAILRLDTDWYESTMHELIHLYPRLVPYGVLIIDDYGHWQGARRAVDEYIARLNHPLHLVKIDYTGRIVVKPSLDR